MSGTKDCTWMVTRVVGRNEFQSRSERVRCGRPVEHGLYCPKHNALADKQRKAAEFKRQQRMEQS